MAKNVSAAFQTHIDGECTTLATLWRVTRTDNEQFFFTDHDRNVVINVDDVTDTDNDQSYVAETGFTRSSIANTADLSVDSMNIESLLDASGVLERDVRAGLWDFAEIEVFMVNWDDHTDGIMQLRRGYLGEISIRDEIYFAELRGLIQILQQNVGDIYTPGCRATHGDPACGFDLTLTTQTTEVDTIDADNRIITVPDHYIERSSVPLETDWLLRINTKIDDSSDDPALGRLTVIRKLTIEEGTPRNPFMVATTADLDSVRDDMFACYALANDIDMSGFGLFDPIGAPEPDSFFGMFDGRGYEIQTIDLDHSAAPLSHAVGLFGVISRHSIIRRVGMLNPDVNGGISTQYKAALVGQATDSVAGRTIIIEDNYVYDTGVGNVETSGNRAGGLIGFADDCILRRNIAAISITGAIGSLVGGLVGLDNLNATIFENYQDSDVGITARGANVSTSEVIVDTTANLQERVTFTEPAGASPSAQSLLLPDRDGAFFDFYTIWNPPVSATSLPDLRQWY